MRKVTGVVIAAMFGVLLLGVPAHADDAPQTTEPAAERTAPARAPLPTEQNGVCEAGELCLYFNSNCQGSMADFYYNVPDFAGYVFLSPGNGRGQPVKNNAASARNRDDNLIARVYFNSNYRGTYDNVSPTGQCRQLVNTYNENASYRWY